MRLKIGDIVNVWHIIGAHFEKSISQIHRKGVRFAMKR